MLGEIHAIQKNDTKHDLSVMTTDRKILPNYRDDLEHQIKNLFIWALGESAVKEMT